MRASKSSGNVSLNDRSTATSIGSSSACGFDATAAHSRISSFVNPGAHQIWSWKTLILAVVSVPVLSEHNTVIDAISCIAWRCVTIACCLAISPAPSASVTCITTGSATGTAAMRIAKHASNVVTVDSPRHFMVMKTATRNNNATDMTRSQTRMIDASNTDTEGFVDWWMSIVAEPVSVRTPVRWTRQYAFPLTTRHPAKARRLPDASGHLRGKGSPVSAAVSTASASPSRKSTSAGIESPPLRKTTSPGTRSTVDRLPNDPSLFTTHVGANADLIDATFCNAVHSS
mmetsp:Transcript_35128/g.108834  ORF Transcript_35128/g.108834 Transcript_35128/m.108834 type:complete len:287 (-) Transcript_35128:322-1182(-)